MQAKISEIMCNTPQRGIIMGKSKEKSQDKPIKKKRILPVLFILLLLVAIGAGVYFFVLKPDDESDNKKENKDTQESQEQQDSDEGTPTDASTEATNDDAIATNTDSEADTSDEDSISSDNNSRNFVYNIDINTVTHSDFETGKFNGSCDVLTMTGDNYPELTTAINQSFTTFYADYMAKKTEYTATSASVPDGEMYYYLYKSVIPMRADEKIFSFQKKEVSYNGGQTENISIYGMNYDVKTGKNLGLGDLGNIEADMQIYMVSFVRDNNLASVVGENFADDLSALMDSEEGLPWVLTGDGIYVVYEINYDQGAIDMVIPYNALPGFKEEYLPDDYGFTLIPGYGSEVDEVTEYGYYTDFNNDDINEFLKLELVFDEYFYGVGINVHIDNEVFEINDLYFYSVSPYLVRTSPEDTYLLFTTGADNDYKTLYVYKVSMDGVEKITAMPKAGVDYIYLDSIVTKTKIDRLGSFMATRTYTLSDDGMTPIEARYDYNNGVDAENRRHVEVKQPVNVKLMQGDKLVDSELAVGTILYPANTDDESVVGFYLEDGTYGELYFEEADNGFEMLIDGVSEYEIFNNLTYAG